MYAHIKQKWVDALRSGDYQQGTGCLEDEGRYCCLGVLTDLYAREHGLVFSGEVLEFKGKAQDEVLCLPVMRWAGLTKSNPEMLPTENVKNMSLASMNDAGHSFNRIADVIEEQL